ncbi:hypothetical protein LguiB_027314 [Lonicera macranthoides]
MVTLIEDKFVTAESLVEVGSGINEVDTNQEPYEGITFESDLAAKAFYDEYAKRVGFFTRIVSSRKSERDGSIISRRFACNKEGYNLNRQKAGGAQIRKRKSKREGCMAMILVKRDKPGKWAVTKFVREHNHPLVVSSGSDRPTPDDKDRRIKELSTELQRTNLQLKACREQLRIVMEYIEEHAESLSRTVEKTVRKVKETDESGCQ